MVIAAILAVALGIESTWVVIVMWFAVIFSPLLLQAGWQSARQRLRGGQRLENDIAERSATPHHQVRSGRPSGNRHASEGEKMQAERGQAVSD